MRKGTPFDRSGLINHTNYRFTDSYYIAALLLYHVLQKIAKGQKKIGYIFRRHVPGVDTALKNCYTYYNRKGTGGERFCHGSIHIW
jgi:hypothetical protein